MLFEHLERRKTESDSDLSLKPREEHLMDGDVLNFLSYGKSIFLKTTKNVDLCGLPSCVHAHKPLFPCQHCQHLNTSPCCTSLPRSENVITDRRRTNGKERETNAKKTHRLKSL